MESAEKELSPRDIANIIASSYFHSQGQSPLQSFILNDIAVQLTQKKITVPPMNEIPLAMIEEEMVKSLQFKKDHRQIRINLQEDAKQYLESFYKSLTFLQSSTDPKVEPQDTARMAKEMTERDLKHFDRRLGIFKTDPSSQNEPSFLYAFGFLKRTIPANPSVRYLFSNVYERILQQLTSQPTLEFDILFSKAKNISRT
jgi:hypothetical protein